MMITLTPDFGAPSAARQMADSFLDELLTLDAEVRPETRRQLQLVVSEMVTNAVQHGEPPIQIEFQRRSRSIRIDVMDQGPGMPEKSSGNQFDRGRGLSILSQVSQGWGVHPHSRGKTVWCEVSI